MTPYGGRINTVLTMKLIWIQIFHKPSSGLVLLTTCQAGRPAFTNSPDGTQDTIVLKLHYVLRFVVNLLYSKLYIKSTTNRSNLEFEHSQ